MKRRSFIKVGIGGTMALTAPELLFNACSPSKKRNILFIMSDDHACQAISAYDGTLNQTPQLDRLASEGMRFENCFCTNAICAPSRAVILTGKHSHINGHIDNGKVFDGSQQTFPKLLRQRGYQTAMVGKWHLISDPTGFDYWTVLPGQGNYYNPDFIEMGTKSRVEGYVTDLITDKALEWLDKRDRSENFCLMLQHKAPHRNWMPNLKHLDLYKDVDIPMPDNLFDNFETRSEALKTQEINIEGDLYLDYDFKVPLQEEAKSPETRAWTLQWEAEYGRMTKEQKQVWDAAYKEENEAFLNADLQGEELEKWKYQRYLKDYLRCIASVDENIGRVLDYLKENGLEENTLVVYTSDQGFFLGEHGLFDKRFMYEESLRMPLIVRLPGAINPSVNDSDLVQNLDFAPTLLNYAGVPVPEDMQGRSLMPLLKDATPADWRDGIYFHFYEYPAIGAVKRHYGIRTDRYKLIHFYYDIDAWELYDLENDPKEMNNVIDDPSYAAICKTLETKLQALREQYGDTDLTKYMPKPSIKVEHLALGSRVILKHKPVEKYDAGGRDALTDGWRAPDELNNFNENDVWQGFEGEDLEAVIDLGSQKNISSIHAGFLQQIDSWIFLPMSVRIAFSTDGKNYQELATLQNTLSEREPHVLRKEFAWTGSAETRYLRIVAKNRKTCPDWHPGAGGKAWIFADEIIVR